MRNALLFSIGMAIWCSYWCLKDIEHDLSVIAVEQIKIEHQGAVEEQNAYVKR